MLTYQIMIPLLGNFVAIASGSVFVRAMAQTAYHATILRGRGTYHLLENQYKFVPAVTTEEVAGSTVETSDFKI